LHRKRLVRRACLHRLDGRILASKFAGGRRSHADRVRVGSAGRFPRDGWGRYLNMGCGGRLIGVALQGEAVWGGSALAGRTLGCMVRGTCDQGKKRGGGDAPGENRRESYRDWPGVDDCEPEHCRSAVCPCHGRGVVAASEGGSLYLLGRSGRPRVRGRGGNLWGTELREYRRGRSVRHRRRQRRMCLEQGVAV
jgi:hypothetical protein